MYFSTHVLNDTRRDFNILHHIQSVDWNFVFVISVLGSPSLHIALCPFSLFQVNLTLAGWKRFELAPNMGWSSIHSEEGAVGVYVRTHKRPMWGMWLDGRYIRGL